jgi:putative peptidoglycan lipid II flippase
MNTGSSPLQVTSATQERSAKSTSLFRSAGIVSIAVFTSRITGLVREMVMAALFGAGKAYDAFSVGFRIPNLTRDLFAEGALSSAFVPVFTEYLSTRSKEQAAALARLVATALVVIVGSFCLLGVIFAPQLVELVAPGYAAVPDKFELAVTMTRIMFPFLLLVALAAQAMGILNACNQFGVPAMASTFFNIGSLVVGLGLGFYIGPKFGFAPIYGMAWGVVFGGALQLFWQVPSLRKSGFRFHLAFNWSDPGLVRILRLMGPAILGNAAVQVNVMVNTNFASQIQDPVRGPDGPVSWLGYAFRFMQLPIGIFGVAIASATLPAISRSVALGNMEEFKKTLSRSIAMVFLLTVPSAIGLVVLRESIIGAIYQIGRFKQYDTEQTGLALACYAIGLAGYAATKVVNPAFYALDDARTPMIVSLVSIIINFSMASTLIHGLGLRHYGLALSTSTVAIFSAVALFWLMRNRLGGLYGRSLRDSTVKIFLASLAMGAVVWASSHGIHAAFGISKLVRLADLALSIPLGLLAYYSVCRALGVPELEIAVQTMAGPLRRRFSR